MRTLRMDTPRGYYVTVLNRQGFSRGFLTTRGTVCAWGFKGACFATVGEAEAAGEASGVRSYEVVNNVGIDDRRP